MRGNDPADGSPALTRMWSGWRIASLGLLAIAVLLAGGYYVRVVTVWNPRQAIQHAATASAAATSASVRFSTQVSGLTVLYGTVREQGTRSRMATLTMTAVDGAVRFRVSEVVTAANVYLSTPGLVRALGKRWLAVPVQALSAAPAMAQLYQTNALPDAGAGLLAVASTVRLAGTTTVKGVPTSRYVGTINPETARVKLGQRLRQLLAPELTATTGLISFTAWINGQHTFSKIETSAIVGGRQTVTTLIFTATNSAAHIAVPAASEVAGLPVTDAARRRA